MIKSTFQSRCHNNNLFSFFFFRTQEGALKIYLGIQKHVPSSCQVLTHTPTISDTPFVASLVYKKNTPQKLQGQES